MKKLFYFAVIILLFFGINVFRAFGWTLTESSPTWQKIMPSFYILFFIVFIISIKSKDLAKLYKKTKAETKIFIFLGLLSIALFAFGQKNFFNLIINPLLLPVSISFILSYYRDTRYSFEIADNLRKIIITFFVIEVGIALFERFAFINIFPFGLEEQSMVKLYQYSIDFRSTALQNHPLSNALIVSTIMGFLLFSNIKYKFFLWFLGYLAILCFNTRSSMFGWIIFMFIYIIYEFFFHKEIPSKNKAYLIFSIIVFISISLFLIFTFNYGGRLLDMGLLDEGSAGARMKIWDIFSFINPLEFLWGRSMIETNYIASLAGVPIIENFWIIYIIRFGLIITGILIFLFIKLFKKILSGYSFFTKWYVLLIFLLIASTNNSLASASPALAVFILCAYAFSPAYSKINENKIKIGNFNL